MRRVSVMMIVLMMSLGLCASVRSAILFDDFNDDSGILTGETANTGQIWSDISGRVSCDVGTQFGQGSIGAGNEIDNAEWKANQIALGQTVNDGTIVVEVDFKKQHRTSPVNEVNIALKSTTQGKMTTLIWNADWLKVGGSWTFGGGQINTGVPSDIHAVLTLHLVAGGSNTASISYYEIGNPSNNGSLDLPGSIVGTLNYDALEIWAYTAGNKLTGFDNVSVTPEPATIGLLLFGVVGLFRRSK